MGPIMLERLSTVAALPGSYQITPGRHTATADAIASSRSLDVANAKTVQPLLDTLCGELVISTLSRREHKVVDIVMMISPELVDTWYQT